MMRAGGHAMPHWRMAFPTSRITGALLACALASVSSLADSSTSSASSAGSASIGSLSDSVTGISGSISKVAEGDYRIVEVTAGQRPDTLRLKLQPVALASDDAAAIVLEVPRLAMADRDAAPGGVVGVRQRPYGYEFAWADTRVAFFLALAPDWKGELESRPL